MLNVQQLIDQSRNMLMTSPALLVPQMWHTSRCRHHTVLLTISLHSDREQLQQHTNE
jgi:hypothetical protein